VKGKVSLRMRKAAKKKYKFKQQQQYVGREGYLFSRIKPISKKMSKED
jgi:hypothetical protein